MCLARMWAKVKIPVSGLFNSWATPAASRPTEDSFSERMICVWASLQVARLVFHFLLEFLGPALQFALCCLELLGHLHKRAGQLPDFIVARDRDGHVEVAVGHALRALQQALHGAIDQSVNQERAQSAHDAGGNDAPDDGVACGACHALIRVRERHADINHTQQFLLPAGARGRRHSSRTARCRSLQWLPACDSRCGESYTRDRLGVSSVVSGCSESWHWLQPSAVRSTTRLISWPSDE